MYIKIEASVTKAYNIGFDGKYAKIEIEYNIMLVYLFFLLYINGKNPSKYLEYRK